ncbi:ABC transporter ATP-binding protein [Auritidibacter ignavus]|uniref:ABC transporter ATP-binding protein n=1 Tax=Auritidibacter ignavus TaxID=678932 RepID=UPI0024492155|nr:ABC transporter ATP-binding protein [Auritidibacter ignavus]WGH81225.1 ABC transporter ATP-binding protein [Auritidibacter ignavus]
MTAQTAAHSSPRFFATAGRVLRLFGAHWRMILLVPVLAVVSVMAAVAAPLMLGAAMDVIFSGAVETDYTAGAGINFSQLNRYALLTLALYGVAQGFEYLQGLVVNRVSVQVVYRLRQRIEAQLNRVPLAWVDDRARGDLLSRTTNDVDNLHGAIQGGMVSLINGLMTLIGIAVMMLALDWQLALVALGILPAGAIVVVLVGARSHRKFTEQWAVTGEVNARVEETVSSYPVVVAFGRAQRVRDQFREDNQRLYAASAQAEFYSGLIYPLMEWITQLAYVGLAVLGALKVAGGSMTLGGVTAFIQYSRQFSQPVSEVASTSNMVISAVVSAGRIFEFLDAEPEADPAIDDTEPDATSGRGAVRFEDVSFSYTDEPLIREINLDVAPGEMVAIVGPTGAGKTTLVNLLMRFYELDAGRITLDGEDISKISRVKLRRKIGMVLQDGVVLTGTIAENLRLGRPEATEAQLIAAAKATRVHEFVTTLPEGYDTEISLQAENLSVGELQRLTIARAFLADPKVLILDEATSSVDTRTEELIQQGMATLRADRTTFVIAHRLSTIRHADHILVMDHGRIVEQGRHEQLLRRGGAYARLYHDQYASHGATHNGATHNTDNTGDQYPQ